MSQVTFTDHRHQPNKSNQTRGDRPRSATRGVTNKVSSGKTPRALPTREAAHRRNNKILANLQVTEARLRSLSHYGPANAILEAELARLAIDDNKTT